MSTSDLVLEGGGVLGIAHVGAVSVLERQGGLSFPRIAGSSAGAIVGALLAAGIPTERMEDVMRELDYRQFRDASLIDRVPLLGPAASVLLEDGIYEGQAVREFVGNLLADQGVETWADLRIEDDPGSHLGPDQSYRLVVTAADTTLGELVRLPWDYRARYGLDPDRQRVADAVRASTAIPYYYEPEKLTHGDGETESRLVDGGLLSNYPIDTFDRTDGRPARWPTVGVKLIPRLPADAAKLFPLLGVLRGGPLHYLESIILTTIFGRDQALLAKPWIAERTVFVDTGPVNPVDFGIGREEQAALFEAGREAAEAFLARCNHPG